MFWVVSDYANPKLQDFYSTGCVREGTSGNSSLLVTVPVSKMRMLKHCILNMTYNPNFDISLNRMSDHTMVAHCSHKEKQSKCYNKLKILELMSKLNKNKI